MLISASCRQEEVRGKGYSPERFPEASAQECLLPLNPALAGEGLILIRVLTLRW